MATPNPCGSCGSSRYYGHNYEWFCGDCHTMLDEPESAPVTMSFRYFIVAVLAIGFIGLFIWVRSYHPIDPQYAKIQQEAWDKYQSCVKEWTADTGYLLQDWCGNEPPNPG